MFDVGSIDYRMRSARRADNYVGPSERLVQFVPVQCPAADTSYQCLGVVERTIDAGDVLRVMHLHSLCGQFSHIARSNNQDVGMPQPTEFFPSEQRSGVT